FRDAPSARSPSARGDRTCTPIPAATSGSRLLDGDVGQRSPLGGAVGDLTREAGEGLSQGLLGAETFGLGDDPLARAALGDGGGPAAASPSARPLPSRQWPRPARAWPVRAEPSSGAWPPASPRDR